MKRIRRRPTTRCPGRGLLLLQGKNGLQPVQRNTNESPLRQRRRLVQKRILGLDGSCCTTVQPPAAFIFAALVIVIAWRQRVLWIRVFCAGGLGARRRWALDADFLDGFWLCEGDSRWRGGGRGQGREGAGKVRGGGRRGVWRECVIIGVVGEGGARPSAEGIVGFGRHVGMRCEVRGSGSSLCLVRKMSGWLLGHVKLGSSCYCKMIVTATAIEWLW